MEIILIRMGEGGAGVNVFWVDRTLSLFYYLLRYLLWWQIWKCSVGGSGKGKEDWIVDCFLGWWWVMSSPHNALSRQNAAGGHNLAAIMIWNIWEPRKDNHKICPLSLRFRPFWYLGQYPPLRVGECRLPHCLNIAVVSSAAGARCCQTSDDRRQEQSPETGPLATQGTPTVWGTGGPGLFIKTVKLCKSHRLHLFVNNLLFTYRVFPSNKQKQN